MERFIPTGQIDNRRNLLNVIKDSTEGIESNLGSLGTLDDLGDSGPSQLDQIEPRERLTIRRNSLENLNDSGKFQASLFETSRLEDRYRKEEDSRDRDSHSEGSKEHSLSLKLSLPHQTKGPYPSDCISLSSPESFISDGDSSNSRCSSSDKASLGLSEYLSEAGNIVMAKSKIMNEFNKRLEDSDNNQLKSTLDKLTSAISYSWNDIDYLLLNYINLNDSARLRSVLALMTHLVERSKIPLPDQPVPNPLTAESYETIPSPACSSSQDHNPYFKSPETWPCTSKDLTFFDRAEITLGELSFFINPSQYFKDKGVYDSTIISVKSEMTRTSDFRACFKILSWGAETKVKRLELYTMLNSQYKRLTKT